MTTETPEKPQASEADEEQKLRVHLGQFVMDFIKALLKTGYYDPNHPEARQARSGLHAQFHTLTRDRFELGFVRTASAENPEIIVEGVLREPLGLAALLGKGVGALFVPKLYEYFERHALQSFAIKAGITAEEFEGLIDVITREPGAGRGGAKANLGEVLLERKILHVSLLFAEELVGRERRMNWRVRLALSRLKKDLRVVPLYRHAGEQALQRATRQIIEDVVRPVGRPDLLCTLLLNCDLVALDQTLLGDVPLERQLVQSLPPLVVGPTLAATTKEVAAMAQAAGGMDSLSVAPRMRHLLVDLADRAQAVGGDAGYDALTGLFQAKLLGAVHLSQSLKEFLQAQRFAQSLATDPAAGLAQLRDLLARGGQAAAALVGPLVADLLRRGQFAVACDTLRLAQEFPEAAALVSQALSREAAIRPLLQKFATDAKGAREQLVEVFVLIGPPAVGPLLGLFSHSDRGLRRAACTAVARLGTAAIGPLLEQLERPNLSWYVVRNILMVLGEIGQEVPLDFRKYIRHEHQRVREEAVAALGRLPVAEAEQLLLNALRDPHGDVRARAVASLGALRTKNIGAVHYMAEAVRRKGPGEKEEDEAVQLQACAAFQQLGNFRYGGEGRIETVLAEALAGPEKRGLLGVFGGGGARPKSPAVRAAIIDTLAAIGTAASADALRRVTETEGGALALRAREALKKAQARPT
ncbi:MAG TPA: HEAT repeat domain-containing protein [Candidatus Methylomirabilis sp.]